MLKFPSWFGSFYFLPLSHGDNYILGYGEDISGMASYSSCRIIIPQIISMVWRVFWHLWAMVCSRLPWSWKPMASICLVNRTVTVCRRLYETTWLRMGIGQMDLVLCSNCTFHMFCESQKCLTPVMIQVLRLSYLLSLWRISVREWIRDSLAQKEELLSGFRAPYHQLLFFCFWRRWCSSHQWTCYHYDGGILHLDHLVIRLDCDFWD